MRKKAIDLLCVLIFLVLPVHLFANDSISINTTLTITYPLQKDSLKNGKVKIKNTTTLEELELTSPYTTLNIDTGNYIIEELEAPEGYMPNINPIRNITIVGGDQKIVKFYNSKKVTSTIPLYYTNHKSNGDSLVDAYYNGIKIGEYYWMDSNMNHIEPYWQWWQAPIGDITQFPIGQEQLNKYLMQVRLDTSYFQIDTLQFHKYYGRYYDFFTINYMNSYARMYEGENKELAGWKLAYVKDFRQLFAMCPFNPANTSKSLSEHDIRFALSSRKGDNPMTEYEIPGDCGTTYWFDSTYVKNIYSFNMMPGGARINRVADDQHAYWSTNLCGENLSFQAKTGDIYHLFYTSKFRAMDGHAGLEDLVQTGYNISYHWYNIRWNRRLSDEELGYKLYVTSKDSTVTQSLEWINFISSGNELPLLTKIRTGEFDSSSFDIIEVEYSPNNDIEIPEGYDELPNGYIRGFYVQYLLADRHNDTRYPHKEDKDEDKDTENVIERNSKENTYTVEDIFVFATNVQEPGLIQIEKPTSVEEEKKTNNISDINIYPNPVKDILNVESSDRIYKINIYNITGRLIKSIDNKSQIDMSNQPNGMYLLKVTTEKGDFLNKILKK